MTDGCLILWAWPLNADVPEATFLSILTPSLLVFPCDCGFDFYLYVDISEGFLQLIGFLWSQKEVSSCQLPAQLSAQRLRSPRPAPVVISVGDAVPPSPTGGNLAASRCLPLPYAHSQYPPRSVPSSSQLINPTFCPQIHCCSPDLNCQVYTLLDWQQELVAGFHLSTHLL